MILFHRVGLLAKAPMLLLFVAAASASAGRPCEKHGRSRIVRHHLRSRYPCKRVHDFDDSISNRLVATKNSSVIFLCTRALPRGGDASHYGSSTAEDGSILDEDTTTSEKNVQGEEFPKHDTNKSDQMQRRKRSRPRLVPRLPKPKQILNGARNLIGRTTNVILLRPRRNNQKKQHQKDEVDHTFDELDEILEKSKSTNSTINGEIIAEGLNEETTLPPLPETAALTKGWQQRSLRAWINKMVSSETSSAVNTIRNIIDAFPDYGVVDLGMYSPNDVIWSIMALSRLQHVLESEYGKQSNNNKNGNSDGVITDKELLEELAHYCAFANAAYGWKGFAFCGRFALGGNNRVLVRTTGIDRRDIVATNWHSKANRPAYYIARDTKRKAIVMGIRGTVSPRDILTDLCASSESFIVEDDPEGIGDISNDSVTGSKSPLIIGRAHKGMVDAAKSVARMTGKLVSDQLNVYPDYSLVIVGHSLGGGVAAVLAAMWKQRFNGRVRSIGYGNPCVFPLNITDNFDNIITVMGSGDPFSSISLGHLADLTKALSKLCQDRGFRSEILERTGGKLIANAKDMSKEDHDWCVNSMDAIRVSMDSEKLLPPGQIYHMSGPLIEFQPNKGSSSGDAAMLKPVDAKIFNELKVHARMFDVSLHIPARYEMILKRLASSGE